MQNLKSVQFLIEEIASKSLLFFFTAYWFRECIQNLKDLLSLFMIATETTVLSFSVLLRTKLEL